ncbi:MAG TPA: hypothetical protein H9867_02170 [Candidatus Corynebacterium gallistercoris]|uniref:Uncharacterized protein n=1 Tax=Candidatus Corynebacterium gallistercoris TaxID=2838530 RepID=A0A9D1RW57_9CORY|nr:hypothetical protein [Candidatus Corynebacterium gallistercoris]
MSNTSQPTDKLAAYRHDLEGAERQAAKQVDYSRHLPFMALGLMIPLIGLFMPHSGQVHGYDVLFFSPTAEAFGTTKPERIYAWLCVTALLLTVGTIVSRSWLVAWVNWAFAGVAWWYSVFAIWMRQSRPVTDPGEGPAFGLIMCLIGLTILFITMSGVIFKRNPLQLALAKARREEVSRDEEALRAQQRLRTGIEPRENAVIEDDRRARAKARRERRQAD